MKVSLPADIYSAADLQGLIVELQTYEQAVMQAETRQRVGSGLDVSSMALSSAAASLLAGSKPDRHLLEEILALLKDIYDQAPRLTITLAAPAAPELRRRLTLWCRSNLSPFALVSFSFSRVILGGMVVRSGSVIHDWSFRKAILDNRHKFPEILQSV